MLRLLSLSICATFLTCALAQSTVTEPTPTTVTEPRATTVTGPTTTPMAPQTTTENPPPTQAPHLPGDYSYSEGNVVCIRLVVNMTLYLEYTDINDQNVIVEPINLTEHASVDVNGSSCAKSKSNILLEFDVFENESSHQFLNFSFQRANEVWNSSDLTYSVNVSTLPNVTPNVSGDVVFTSSGLFKENVDESGSYLCNAPRNVTFKSSSVNDSVKATLGIMNLKVQAFMESKENGQFGSVSYDCAYDQGNKIVPIAVGAALAGLVIVVLIAYLIGRLKSRRQNSYEPLS